MVLGWNLDGSFSCRILGLFTNKVRNATGEYYDNFVITLDSRIIMDHRTQKGKNVTKYTRQMYVIHVPHTHLYT